MDTDEEQLNKLARKRAGCCVRQAHVHTARMKLCEECGMIAEWHIVPNCNGKVEWLCHKHHVEVHKHF